MEAEVGVAARLRVIVVGRQLLVLAQLVAHLVRVRVGVGVGVGVRVRVGLRLGLGSGSGPGLGSAGTTKLLWWSRSAPPASARAGTLAHRGASHSRRKGSRKPGPATEGVGLRRKAWGCGRRAATSGAGCDLCCEGRSVLMLVLHWYYCSPRPSSPSSTPAVFIELGRPMGSPLACSGLGSEL